MPRTAAKVTQADIARVLRAAKAEGMTVEVRPDGTIRVVPVDTLLNMGNILLPSYTAPIIKL